MENTKRYCKGCFAEVTETMFCYCGEFTLNLDATITQSEYDNLFPDIKPDPKCQHVVDGKTRLAEFSDEEVATLHELVEAIPEEGCQTVPEKEVMLQKLIGMFEYEVHLRTSKGKGPQGAFGYEKREWVDAHNLLSEENGFHYS